MRYRLTAQPMIVHCCHCLNCQQQTGSAFAVNLVIETARVELLSGEPHGVDVPREGGDVQTIFRCPSCQVAVFSQYTSPAFRYVRAGTLDDPGAVEPDVHIFTRSKRAWVGLPAGAREYEVFYDPAEVWSDESRARWRAAQ